MASFRDGKRIEYVATAIIIRDDRMLLVHHKKLNLWLPPGGHVEEGELPSECVVREVKEETGLDVEIVNKTPAVVSDHAIPFPTADWTQLEDIQGTHCHYDFVYRCNILGGTLTKSHESNDIRFFEAKEIRSLTDTTSEVKSLADLLLK